MRNTDPNVLVLKRKCAFSLKNSKECFLGCKGYFSASLSPKTSIAVAFTSTVCPLPWLSTTTPFTFKEAPVVMRFNIASSNSPKLATTCTLLLVLPSFNAMNWLFRKVRTHPMTTTSAPTADCASVPLNNCLILTLWLNILVISSFKDNP